MSISFVVILSLPILFITGSLRKAVYYIGMSRLSFILFFICAAAFSFLPVLKIIPGIRIDLQGAFFCIAPGVYLAVKRCYSYGYYLTFVLTALFAVAFSFFSNTFTMPYLPYLIDIAIAAAAAISFKSKGPVFAPVMMGIYGLGNGLMQYFSGMGNFITLFGNIDMMTLCAALCLFVSYVIRPRGKHCAHRALQTQDNKG